MKKLFSVICASVLVLSADAQYFRWKSPVNAYDTTGYTRILLQPEVTTELREGYPDVRLYDQDQQEVAYIIAKDRLIAGTTRFVEYPVVEKRDEPGHCWVTVENPLHKTDPLDRICLEINNPDTRSGMTLVGSYDNRNWYQVRDEYSTSSYQTYSNGKESATTVVAFDFPLTNYRYFRFVFDNWHYWWRDYGAPVFVVRAGVLVNANAMTVPEQKMELPGVTFTAKQYGNTTAVDIQFATPQYVDYMQLDVSAATGPGTFWRPAKLYILDSTHVCDTTNLPAHFTSTMLSRGGLNEFSLGGRKVQHLCIHIENEDDQPLNVNGIQAIQIRQFLVAWLEKGKQYHIEYGSDSAAAPRYDMRHGAQDLVLHEMSLIGTSGKESLAVQTSAAVEASSSPLENRILIWSAIAVVILILGWMSTKMLREMKKD